MMLEKLVSGGQTGVDRAALDAALAAGVRAGAAPKTAQFPSATL